MKPRVVILRSDSKFNTVDEAIRLLGGIQKFVKPGEEVLLKPNLFTVKSAAEGATTELELIRKVGQTAKKNGCKVAVGECPATSAYTRPDIVFDGLGVRQLCIIEGFSCRALDRDKPILIDINGKILKEVWLPETATLSA